MADSPNSSLPLEQAGVSHLEVFANPADLRRDIQVFVEYAQDYEIKRSHRGNAIPRGHQERLAKGMSSPELAGKFDAEGRSAWIDHVDKLALKLGLAEYDTQGEYAGYSSTAPSFADNYMAINGKVCRAFFEGSLQAQEDSLLEKHLAQELNEFFHRGPLTRSDPFDRWGSACGVVPTINFRSVRLRLLALLNRCPPGVWLSTAALIEHLRQRDPWFLIPRTVPAQAVASSMREGRYGNFAERKRGDWGNGNPIVDTDPDGFAKVEGRFIERFLEGFPLALGYVDVAYQAAEQGEMTPQRGFVRAFRVNERLVRSIRKEIAEPKVTVLPNFEVHLESLFFAARVEAELGRFGELVQRGIVTVFKLTKPKLAADLAAHPDTKPVERLHALSKQPVPANVRQELEDWAAHSEKFILYEGFSVLEGLRDTSAASEAVVEEIGPKLALIRDPAALCRQLEAAEQIPIRFRHPDEAFSGPAGVKSLLAAKPAPPSARVKPPLKVKRNVQITLQFAVAEAHEAFAQLLLEAKCIVPSDRRALTVSYTPRNEAIIRDCLKKLGGHYVVQLEEVEA